MSTAISGGTYAVVSTRPRGLLICAGLTVLLHAAVLFSPWSMHSIVPDLPREQDVEVDLEGAPPETVPQEIPAPEPVDSPLLPDPEPPVPEPEPEPISPPKPVPAVKKERPATTRKATPRQASPQVRNTPAAGEESMSSRPVVTAPELLPAFKNRKPEYPRLARQRGQEGTVLLRLSIDPEGTVLKVEIVQSSGHTLLDDAAVTSLRRWRFKPAESDGTRVSGSVMVPVEFRLQ